MTKLRIVPLAAWLTFAAAGGGPAAAADGPPADAKAPYRARLVGLPFVYYTPETKLAFGAGALLNFRAGRNKEEARTSTVWAYANYTLARQFSVLLKPEIYLRKNSLFLNGSFRYERVPQLFYGVGNDTPSTGKESYTPRTFAIQIGVKRRLVGGLYGGVQFDVEETTMESVEAGGLLDTGTIAGSRGGMLAGLGASLDWDTRDTVLFSRRGTFVQLSADAYGGAAGSDFSFSRVKLDLRQYLPVGTDRVLALQAYLLATGGDVPFYKLALLGGDSLLRGYYRGRFRDKALFLVQAEYRALITKRIGVVGFAGLADVSPGLGDVARGRLKYSVGTGMRYVINKRDGTTVRLDLAWGRACFGLYATAQEAF
jgi:outer membrane protein assembly factor BamA